ncbi:hypothetical protein Snoj_42220 [Streptomyces nojiriensis]|uniref:Uncharacterized protein n=1 Tax=Streptomyces nojiriensis TaxID=66374 RepID=A0ABQ3SQ91_9ACTN|nr:hypothetical protein [Streptomyces nojiriensis]GGR84104.1 hypothetical protein GCM10010205_10880 [Streptomyces nojiriensis]GHI70304.1 hypothetical protein Snoj_42220 [Streptomyces nojiriensis]
MTRGATHARHDPQPSPHRRPAPHFPWDATNGLALGDKVANQVFTTKLRAL